MPHGPWCYGTSRKQGGDPGYTFRARSTPTATADGMAESHGASRTHDCTKETPTAMPWSMIEAAPRSAQHHRATWRRSARRHAHTHTHTWRRLLEHMFAAVSQSASMTESEPSTIATARGRRPARGAPPGRSPGCRPRLTHRPTPHAAAAEQRAAARRRRRRCCTRSTHARRAARRAGEQRAHASRAAPAAAEEVGGP